MNSRFTPAMLLIIVLLFVALPSAAQEVKNSSYTASDGMWAVFTFEDAVEGKTRVASAGAGYLEGEGYDIIYGFFEKANEVS